MTYRKKQKLYFALILLIPFLDVLFVALVFSTKWSYDIKWILVSLLLFISLLLSIYLKYYFDFYSIKYAHFRLLENRIRPLNANSKIYEEEWFNSLKVKHNYTLFKKFTSFSLYYKFDYIRKKNKRSKSAIFLVVINDNTSFDSSSIVTVINEFEDKFFKSERFNNHIIMQIKKSFSLNKQMDNEVKSVLFHKQKKSHYVILINGYFLPKEKKFAFLYNKDYSPNAFYSYATKELMEIIK